MLLSRPEINVIKIMKRACLKINFVRWGCMKVVGKLVKEVDFINFVDIVVSVYPGRMGGLEPTREQLKTLFMHNQNNETS